jgi:RNA polymerase sigma-70 factor (ECF subfamily)
MELEPTVSPKAEEDRILVSAAKSGDQKAFEDLMKKYRKSVYYMLLKMVYNPDDAEDLTQEAFAKAFTSLHKFDSKFAFSTWLFRIATNNCIDFIRKKKLLTYSIDQPVDEDSDRPFFIDIRDKNYNPNEEMIHSERSQIIHEAVEKLPQRYKILVQMRYFDEKAYEELADELNLPLGTVKAQLHRARELLNELLANIEEQL